MMQFHSLQVTDKRRLTADATALTLQVPAALRDEFRHAPGQYIGVQHDAITRCYSLTNLPGEALQIGVKRVAGGRLSEHLVARLQPGMRLQVAPPQGRFIVRPKAGKRYAAFAAGSGITPVLCIVHAALQAGAECALFYGNGGRAQVMFRDELAALKDRYPSRLQLHHILSREVQDVELLHGRLDAARVHEFARLGLLQTDCDAYFLCGPGGMIESVGESLIALGVSASRIRSERYINVGVEIAAGAGARPMQPAADSGVVDSAAAQVEIIADGGVRRFAMSADTSNIIDAAAAAGIELPHSCKAGMCCTCRCKVLRGEVTMAVNYSLEKWELDAGFVLACQSRPVGDVTVDFDVV